ncbi:CBS domain-containing protein [Nonomuraea soli]|uniref:CBS-domain-containing membrane protein n=1 Tax=Nonomuraea soli TaxID=1032476 RepID=A0A7W0HNV4_9ACTN|nr:CBS domain-containing protein [Nonomuraea soli]MBA2889961.1 CBS-domain-containing membrane protein [Nonomuraea soli]
MRVKVNDVMTCEVVAVNEKAAFHTVAELLIQTSVSGVPVIDADDHVVGVISEADLLRKEEFKQQYYGDDYRPPLRARLRHLTDHERGGYDKSLGETARDLMTSPAVVTIRDTPVVAAARLMDRHGIKRLPVVDADGKLIGIVSRRDLIRVFVRDDQAIKEEVVRGLPLHAVAKIDVAVADGIVTLTGQVDKYSQALFAARHAENVDGVVGLRDELGWKTNDLAQNYPMYGGA